MSELEQRMLRLPNGKRMPVRLDDATWRAVDWLAKQAHKQWSEWCAAVIAASPDTNNVTAEIRAAAMKAVMESALTPNLATPSATELCHPMLSNGRLRVLQAADVDAELHSMLIEETLNFAAFELVAGDRDGIPSLLIRSKVENDFSAVLSVISARASMAVSRSRSLDERLAAEKMRYYECQEREEDFHVDEDVVWEVERYGDDDQRAQAKWLSGVSVA